MTRITRWCVDEGGKQLIGDIREPLPVRPGSPAKQDYEYERQGMANLFMAAQPLGGQRHVEVTQRKTAVDFARFLKRVSDEWYPDARKVVLGGSAWTGASGTSRRSRRRWRHGRRGATRRW